MPKKIFIRNGLSFTNGRTLFSESLAKKNRQAKMKLKAKPVQKNNRKWKRLPTLPDLSAVTAQRRRKKKIRKQPFLIKISLNLHKRHSNTPTKKNLKMKMSY